MKTFRLSLIALSLFPLPGIGDDLGAEVQTSAAPKTPAIKTITNFTQSLRCMDELFYAYGKQGIAITSAGIPDETGKVKTGTKEMLITAVSKMTVKSNAFDFIDFHSAADDLSALFAARGEQNRTMPDYYIRGSITQMDDNTVRKNKGIGFSLPFLDLGASKDDGYDLLSMDISIGDAATRKIIPVTSTSNTLVLSKGGVAGEGGGKIGKLGLSFNIDISRSEGVGAATRTLVELGLIEALGKFTQVPYWKCLDTDLTNPLIREQAREWYDNAKENDRVLFVQRKLAGMGRYAGPLNGIPSAALKASVAEYQAATGLVADGVINFDLYASLLDDLQNQIAALPAAGGPKSNYVPGVSPAAPRPPAATQVVASPAAGPSGAPNPIFRMKLDTDRGSKPSYRVGEFLNMTLSMNAQGTAYCYYQDVSTTTARIFPNQFRSDSSVPAGAGVRLPSGGFKIRFDKPGPERVACIGSDRELIVPSALRGARDLSPLPVRSVDDVVGQFKQNNPTAVTSMVDITVTPQ
jgi:curli biogenesis system outer membrane secretion channel CsgG/peptidoglycan hydrolase-like protein with peptidoglycan-binding domain